MNGKFQFDQISSASSIVLKQILIAFVKFSIIY